MTDPVVGTKVLKCILFLVICKVEPESRRKESEIVAADDADHVKPDTAPVVIENVVPVCPSGA